MVGWWSGVAPLTYRPSIGDFGDRVPLGESGSKLLPLPHVVATPGRVVKLNLRSLPPGDTGSIGGGRERRTVVGEPSFFPPSPSSLPSPSLSSLLSLSLSLCDAMSLPLPIDLRIAIATVLAFSITLAFRTLPCLGIVFDRDMPSGDSSSIESSSFLLVEPPDGSDTLRVCSLPPFANPEDALPMPTSALGLIVDSLPSSCCSPPSSDTLGFRIGLGVGRLGGVLGVFGAETIRLNDLPPCLKFSS